MADSNESSSVKLVAASKFVDKEPSGLKMLIKEPAIPVPKADLAKLLVWNPNDKMLRFKFLFASFHEAHSTIVVLGINSKNETI